MVDRADSVDSFSKMIEIIFAAQTAGGAIIARLVEIFRFLTVSEQGGNQSKIDP